MSESKPESNGTGRSKPFVVLQQVKDEEHDTISWVEVSVVTLAHKTTHDVRRALKDYVTADPKNGGHFRIVQVKDEVSVVGEMRTVAVFS